MKRRKLFSVSLCLILVMSMLASCGNKAENTSGNDNGDAKTYLLGGIGPLTGEAASYGISVKQGAEIAIKEINEAGGFKVGDDTYKFELKFEDDQADHEKAPNAYNTLYDAKVDAILGSVTSGSCIAIVDKTFKDKLLQITPSGSALECARNENNFRLCFTDPLQGVKMAELAVTELGYKKVATIFNSSDDYSTGMKDAFVAKVKELGGEIVAEEAFVKNDVDFSTQLTKIKDSGAEVIFVPTYYKEAALIAKQASEKEMKLPLLGGDGWDGILDQIADASVIEGAIFLSPFLSTDPDAAVQAFVEKYKAAYNATPDQFAADGYDTVYVFKAALEKAGSKDYEALLKAMTEIEVNGLTGKMSFTPEGEPNKDAKFIVIKDGKYTAK